ncbi:PRKR-interacting protein 1 homolog [Pectinophora gossypiella]|uniref:PRKR-interacting protein 1 homolog n=1 Tax=Pectinophora gossypiella TaxID=13191 RepID=UPI00214F26DF|nr:PRKR-interacting protein 1 homolog [Pectinophora gossypiella]
MSDEESKTEEKKPIIIKNATDLQRLKLNKLMKNPEKPVVIPEPPRDKSLPAPPDFVRNVMGSSAGAGSGEFHVYRHLRRKEYARQKFIQEKSEKEKLDEEYHRKIEENRLAAEAKTAKKRAKRLKKKKLKKIKNKRPCIPNAQNEESQSDSSEEEEDATADRSEESCDSQDKNNDRGVNNKEAEEKKTEENVHHQREDT